VTATAVPEPEPQQLSSRERILNTAELLIAEKGYSATSIANIARSSGSPPGSIYWYFESKAGVLKAVLRRGAEQFYADMQEATSTAPPPDPEEALRRWFEAGDASIRKHALFLRICLQMMLSAEQDDDRQSMARKMRTAAGAAVHSALVDSYRSWGADCATRVAEQLADLTHAFFDGLFMAAQFDRESGSDADRSDLIRQYASAVHHHALGLRSTGD
jgi:AcrR family transcriptional regulator